ncbi:MAG: hypothetical protein CML68_06720 [Rhodobacteraceae bacterium]|nr:hypothetical protein [Paracoccaceae bacterium]
MKHLVLALLVAAPPLAAQPAQGWALLTGASISETLVDTADGPTYRLDKTFPPDLVAAADSFEIQGHLVPMEARAQLDRFTLVPDPANCPFCGNSGYGPSLQVHMKRALPDLPEGTLLVLKGRLELNRGPDTFEMYRLVDAQRIAPE